MNPVEAKRRARQPTSFDRKMGVTVAPARPRYTRRVYAAPVLDPLRNSQANGSNRSYSYVTAADLFARKPHG